ncbi:DUF2834 domain-containing protein [Nocardioides jiangxiensis]|uniref:DUF2834 domain-containing protein n=1 Tax=Nocardioides jiangxiensis TaxID=3064524 RepID=A0ABT9AZA4_9ACTN|nr:DUF2834 domain-containing protein [Nocardioides sp. WY-20]MDO7867919.1 DUF2834 domain-containing protein [Nocardioides sp. WY-20]
MERRVHLAIAIVALVATQAALVWHVASGRGAADFLTDAVATPAGVFVVVDLVAVACAALVFMVTEGRRLGIRHLWIYVVLTFTVAISVAFPAFLMVRERQLRWQDGRGRPTAA